MFRRYVLTFFNEGLVSLFNFALSIVLIRYWGRYDYGVFAIVVQIALMLEAFQNALVNAPLSVYVPAMERRAPRKLMEALLSSVSLLITILIAVGSFAFALVALRVEHPLMAAGAVAAFIASRIARGYIRAYFYAQLQPLWVAVNDVVYVVIGAFALVLVWRDPQADNLTAVLAILALAAMLGLAVSLLGSGVSTRVFWRRRLLRRYALPWRNSRWALLGSTTTTLQTRAHTFIVTGIFGPETFAVLAAGVILFGPVNMALQAWGTITRPYLARAVGRGDRREITQIHRISLATVAVAYAVLLGALYVFWDVIEARLYSTEYQDMSLIVILWAGASVITAGRILFGIPLQSMREFRKLAHTTALGAVVSLVSVAVLSVTVGFEYSIVGVGLGEAASLAWVLQVYRKSLPLVTRRRAPTHQ